MRCYICIQVCTNIGLNNWKLTLACPTPSKVPLKHLYVVSTLLVTNDVNLEIMVFGLAKEMLFSQQIIFLSECICTHETSIYQANCSVFRPAYWPLSSHGDNQWWDYGLRLLSQNLNGWLPQIEYCLNFRSKVQTVKQFSVCNINVVQRPIYLW